VAQAIAGEELYAVEMQLSDEAPHQRWKVNNLWINSINKKIYNKKIMVYYKYSVTSCKNIFLKCCFLLCLRKLLKA